MGQVDLRRFYRERGVGYGVGQAGVLQGHHRLTGSDGGSRLDGQRGHLAGLGGVDGLLRGVGHCSGLHTGAAAHRGQSRRPAQHRARIAEGKLHIDALPAAGECRRCIVHSFYRPGDRARLSRKGDRRGIARGHGRRVLRREGHRQGEVSAVHQ